jgi:rSAM/selenodomain-associated transferase 2
MNVAISIIIPALNEQQVLGATLARLQNQADCEQIVVDGGSSDATVALARAAGCRVLECPRGRGRQMNAGAAAASGRVLLFVHADTLLPANFKQVILTALTHPGIAGGAFSLGIDSTARSLAAIALFANLRSRLFQLPYGDQALFTTSRTFAGVGGFPEMAIMEDFVFVKRLQEHGKIVILPDRAITSARRWQNRGVIRTTLINQLIVCGHALGVPPETLAAWYRGRR